MTHRVTRRGFVQASGLAAAGGLASAPSTTRAASAPPVSRHPTISLRRAEPVFALMQSERREVDPGRVAEDLARNLEIIESAVSAAQGQGPHKDWIAFHDGALTGSSGAAISRGGWESSVLASLARRHACWISVGARVRDDQQRHPTLDAVAFFSPDGRLASLQPAEGARALGPGLSLVAVTEFGNLSATPRVDDPVLDAERVAAGAEFLLRAHAGPLAGWALDVPVCCRAHRIHGAVVTASTPAGTPQGATAVAAGGSAFYGPDGRELTSAAGSHEQWVALAVPIGRQRMTSAAHPAGSKDV